MLTKLIQLLADFFANLFGKNKYSNKGMPSVSSHYLTRCAAIAAENKSGGVMFAGDSITEGWMVDVHEKLLPCPVNNHGIAGDTTRDVLNRINLIIKAKPSKLFLLIGTNNLGWDSRAAFERLVPDIISIVQLINACIPSCKVYVQSLLPINEELDVSAEVLKLRDPEDINKANIEILKACSQNKMFAEFVNLYPFFTDDSGIRLRAAYTTDGLHLSDAGYEMWAKLISPYMTK